MTEETNNNRSGIKKARAAIILFLIIAVFIASGLHWWIRHQTHIETDNSFVEAHIHSIASKVPGNIVRILVKDNQLVKKGDLLVEIDPSDYKVQVEKTEADVEIARNETGGETSQVAVAKAAVLRAKAQRDQAGLDLKRGKVLFEKEVIPREQLDRLETAEQISAAQLIEAEEAMRKAKAIAGGAGGGKDARVRQKSALLADARLKLSYTRIYAVSDGYITKKAIEQGNIIQAGQPLMALVPLNSTWIIANYKEGRMEHIRVGQKVEFKVDAYPGKKFTGKVESIMAGTGAAFSLLPPENATGNYVKVVQRIPVKISIDSGTDPDRLLRVGMSVIPTILVERKTSDILREMIPFL